MRRHFIACVALGALSAVAHPASGAGVVQRYLLVAGANHGGVDRPQLQYAVSDAERFARVLVELGGVPLANEIVLKEPKLRDLVQALDQISARIAAGNRAAAGSGGGRSELLVYYSGHADEKGLLLGEDRYSYQSFRERLDQIPADVRIAVLDACASGAFIRIKGGKKQPAFLVDESSSMRGHAFLTSSAATEAAQESDRIGASYFTHYLVSGLRGAADLSGDGKVTLNEAYQFAFNETLGRTEQTRGGAQHPSYDITMSGSGDVVMTDVRQTSATLALGEEMSGRFFIRNAAQQLVVELYKPAGRKVELGLEPGSYEVRLERDSRSFVGRTQVGDGGRVVIDAALFHVTAPEPARRRGNETPGMSGILVSGRNRIEFGVPLLGNTGSYGSAWLAPWLQYTRHLKEKLAVTASVGGIHQSATYGGYMGAGSIVTMPVGLRWTPLVGDLSRRTVRPYLAGGFGPVFASFNGFTDPQGRVYPPARTVTVEGQVGGGVDFLVGRSWAVDLSFTTGWINRLPQNRQYDVGNFSVSVGWLFGAGRRPR